MATMIPADVEDFSTPGEKHFYRFLEAVAKPDQNYFTWYLPDIKDREPDFLMFSDQVGLIIFEVKDWALEQIQEANPKYFVLDIGGKRESRKNPFSQAKEYFFGVMEKIQEDGKLVSKESYHHGKPKIPINYGVVFPNINKYEYTQKGLDQVTGTDKIFFWDDLHPDSPLCMDKTGKSFFDAMSRMFSPLFNFKISRDEINYLKQLIFPVVRIELPDRASSCKQDQEEKRIKVLDHNQEALARKWEGGHRIIKGPSGSGKTLILVHKAALLGRYNPNIKRILFVCYNITLVNYIKRLLSNHNVPIGKNGVEVCHVFELCSKILGEDINYEGEDADYYEMVIQEALERAKEGYEKYDAILVDEGQDFSDEMFKLLVSILNEKTSNMTIAMDDNQNIYRRKVSWSKLGIAARGRVHSISYVYRNTQEIAEFAARFIGQARPADEKAEKQQPQLFADFFSYHGQQPEVARHPSIESVIEFTAKKIQEMANSGECPYSEVAVIYAVKSTDQPDKGSIPQMIIDGLESEGITCYWASEDYRAKKAYDITTNSVTVTTIHSAKGLDYKAVFLIGLDYLAEKTWADERVDNLVYVAMTRARHSLFMPYVQETELIAKLIYL